MAACGDKVQEQAANGKQTIKIGGIFPLSGSQASMGEAAKAGMLKALSELDQDNLHYNYELVFEDNQGKLPAMSAIANKLVSQDKVDAIGTMTSAYAKVMAPIADQHGVVQWVFSFEEKDYKRFGKYAFVQGVATQDIATETYNWLKAKKADNVAIFAQNAGVIAATTASLEDRLKQSNTKYVINTFNPGERDFRLTIAKAKESGFTKFTIQAFPPEKDIIQKQMNESGIAKENILIMCNDMTKPISLYEGTSNVCYNQGSGEFRKELVNEYDLSSTFGSAAFYDYVNLMVDAYEHLYKEGEKPSAEAVTAYIQLKKKYGGMSGECAVQDNGFIVNKPMVSIYKNGAWQNID